MIRGIVNFFREHQDANGAIIDPFDKKERQYATPAFACAAAALVASGEAPELRAPAERAFAWAARTLSAGQAADHHEDFFTVLLMHARQMLQVRSALPGATAGVLDIPPFDPEKVYRDVKRETHNWNVVAISGELLRFQAGLAADDLFVENYLGAQIKRFNEYGMYRDPNDPMAYDLFPRLWLTDMVFHGYAGSHWEELDRLTASGAMTSLLMQSPLGELPAGGRSGAHQWNEAQQAATFEMMATRLMRGERITSLPYAGGAQLAGAFKRAAHLSLLSMRRWVRPSGELWIVKNRFAPEQRYGYESYSFHSQYNLLAAAMLAIAWQHANDNIEEWPTPAETGGFAFEIRDGFDKLFANAAGTFVEYELNGDAHYNPTGIIRVHFPKEAVLNDGAVAKPSYGIGRFRPSLSLALGPVWEGGALSDHARGSADPARVRVLGQNTDTVEFEVRYENSGCPITERVRLRRDVLRVRDEIGCASRAAANIPFLVNDGEKEFTKGAEFRVLSRDGQARRLNVTAPTRYGLLDAMRVEAPGKVIEYEIRAR